MANTGIIRGGRKAFGKLVSKAANRDIFGRAARNHDATALNRASSAVRKFGKRNKKAITGTALGVGGAGVGVAGYYAYRKATAHKK